MGVPAFYRWLSEKYPKIVTDVLEERVGAVNDVQHCGDVQALPFDASQYPNPSGLECDHLYLDLNGIIHPCSHPEANDNTEGRLTLPTCEEEMYDNVCNAIDRLMRAIRPRTLLFLAVDGVAPRAKMNQQRARRFRAAEQARELRDIESAIRSQNPRIEMNMNANTSHAQDAQANAWDSNVITPGTHFMRQLSNYVRFYIRQRLAHDPAWRTLRVIFSDASIPGEGEHKIMQHIRLQRSSSSSRHNYNPNFVHVVHGLDADLMMLGLATHEAQFYVSREVVTFGRKSVEALEKKQQESGFREAQNALDQAVGRVAMQQLPAHYNRNTPLQRISIPVLREYWAAEFASCLDPRHLGPEFVSPPNFERLVDDIVFLCFFVGNDFLPHLPSLDIRDGALDYLFNVYKRLLPHMGDYLTKSGGHIQLRLVDMMLREVGSIENHVFQMKYENEMRMIRLKGQQQIQQQQQQQIQIQQQQIQQQQQMGGGGEAHVGVYYAKRGRAARTLESDRTSTSSRCVALRTTTRPTATATDTNTNHVTKDNQWAAQSMKKELLLLSLHPSAAVAGNNQTAGHDQDKEKEPQHEDEKEKEGNGDVQDVFEDENVVGDESNDKNSNGNNNDDDDDDNDNIDEEDDTPKTSLLHIPTLTDAEAAIRFKEKVKAAQQRVLDEHANNVVDTVRLHESGWKDRYYTDKCKAEDVDAHGGREHLFRSYIVGLCWVMKYYYDGVPSWKWYFPFHYAPFASDLHNIERFANDVKALELSTPFQPVEQLMAVLPADSAHAIPQPSRWLMTDPESPIIDFFPTQVPVDPNGKAMPWLWVVLLPFIDEDRLIAALSPTMAQWQTEELLCNARGLDDGYLYVHKSHPLARKLAMVVEGLGDKHDHPTTTTAKKAMKVRLTDAASYGVPGFSGAFRPPLSHEIFPTRSSSHDGDETTTTLIDPPESAHRIILDAGRRESVFVRSVDASEALCVAFSEPPKLSHKSVWLSGARRPEPVLTLEDTRNIHRPRLNRGGGTIAHLGMTTMTTTGSQSHQSGYGSMNISSYERQVAHQTSRGAQMNQTGLRPWGAMEPTAKRVRVDAAAAVAAVTANNVHLPNPFASNQNWSNPIHSQQSQSQSQYNNPNSGTNNYHRNVLQGSHQYPQQQPPNRHTQYPSQHMYQQYPQYQYQQQQHQQHWSPTPNQHYPQYPPQQQQHQQQQQYFSTRQGGDNNNNNNRGVTPAHSQPYPPNQQHPKPQGFHFRSFNNNNNPKIITPHPHPPQRPGPVQQRPPASEDVMRKLKAQLSSTLLNNNKNNNNKLGGG